MKAKIFIIFFILSLVFIGCKKSEETKYVMVPDEFKAWTVYQKDSYWIYLNENINQADSTFVTKCDRSLYTDNDPYIHLYTESYDVRISGKFLINFNITAGEGPYTGQLINEYHALGGGLSMGWLENPYAHFGYNDPSYIHKVVEVIPSFVLNNKTYSNVYNILWAKQNFKGDSVIENYYLAKNIGLIKFKTRVGMADTTWSLLRYHVIQ